MTPQPPTVGLHIIALNEEKTLPNLLASIEGAFDQVVLVDTGSDDATVAVFEDWANGQAEKRAAAVDAGDLPPADFPFFKIGSFERAGEWVDDFAAVRNHADSLLDTDWKSWADCDDIIVGAPNLRALADQAAPHVESYVFGYNYAQDPKGNSVAYLKRERLTRCGHGPWINRVHECQQIEGQAVWVDPGTAEWVHRHAMTREELEAGTSDSNERNLGILRKWLEDEPDNPRVLAYLGTESAIRDEHREALAWYDRYLKLKTGWDEERAQIHRKAAMSLLALDRYEEARRTALIALDVLPQWPDSYLTLGEACLALGEAEKALYWADRVLEMGEPAETMLITNSLDYTFQPLLVKAGALADLGQLDAAVEVGRQALEIHPFHAELRTRWGRWRARAKVEHTASTWAKGIELLVSHDEQLKARAMLATVPHYAQDHPAIVHWENVLASRLAWLEDGYTDTYRTGGPKPEQLVDDPIAVCDQLPRAGFVLAGITEQKEAQRAA